MTERQILFSGPMVRAIIEGQKPLGLGGRVQASSAVTRQIYCRTSGLPVTQCTCLRCTPTSK